MGQTLTGAGGPSTDWQLLQLVMCSAAHGLSAKRANASPTHLGLARLPYTLAVSYYCISPFACCCYVTAQRPRQQGAPPRGALTE